MIQNGGSRKFINNPVNQVPSPKIRPYGVPKKEEFVQK
jgi:hypothetical protein